jgi:hypothetical protein
MDTTLSPTTFNAEQQKSRLSYLRGTCFALLFGAIGFAAPILIVVVFTVLGWIIKGTREFDRKYDLHRLSETLIFPAVGTAWVFAGTGWAVFASRGNRRFMQTLALIASISVPLWYLLAAMGMSPTRYKGMEHPLIYPTEILLFALPPVVIAMVLSMNRSKKYIALNNNDGKG